ncbi:MAG: hypothetical protein AABY22_20795, partial [Nanoarchaeota archaeon]
FCKLVQLEGILFGPIKFTFIEELRFPDIFTFPKLLVDKALTKKIEQKNNTIPNKILSTPSIFIQINTS